MAYRHSGLMRQEALRRSRDMRRAPELGPPHPRLELTPPPPPVSSGSPLPPFLRDLLREGISGERLLVAAVLLLMLREGADKSLVLALGYIML
ncbi:MAG: hypothetical protein IJ071_02585 [Ruminococcus sp.]|nr:hypothetical protein [Ruminococcus sp.]